MVDRLLTKPGGDRVRVLIGDMADVAVEGTFGLVFAAFNTFTNLVTAEDQSRCFENVARHLAIGGSFVIEALAPSSSGTEPDSLRVLNVGTDQVTLMASRYDSATRRLRASYIVIGMGGGVRLIPLEARLIS